jgi:hypothetical protein
MMRALMTKTLFVLSILLSAQALAFDVGGLSYSVINTTDVEVTGRVAGNTDTDIVIPAAASDGSTTYSVTSIGGLGSSAFAFANNALTSVIIPDSVTTIGEGAFAINPLTSVIIPDSVTTIGERAFESNPLTSVIIGNSVETIGSFAFSRNALTSVIIPDSVTSIGDFAFEGNALTSVVIPGNVTTIGGSAFGSNALTSVIIPDSVTAIGDGVFRFNALTSVIIPDSVTSIGDVAFEGNALTSVIIPDSVTAIGIQAFADNALTSVIIPDSVTSIGDVAFEGNALTSVIIPDSVITIGDGAFVANALTSAAFEVDFGLFSLDMFFFNEDLATITYCDARTGWPQGFNNGSTIIVTTPVECDTAPPDAPSIRSITAGDSEGIINFTRGPDNGASITGYTAYCFGDTLAFGESPTSPITVSGLTNGEAYECLVTATNDFGTSPASAASAPFTPAIPPQPPLITNIEPGNGQVSINVSVADDGGSPITGYTAYCYGDTLAFGESPTSPITVFGLTNGQAYVCATTATNNFGTSPASELSAPVTPVAPAPGC